MRCVIMNSTKKSLTFVICDFIILIEAGERTWLKMPIGVIIIAIAIFILGCVIGAKVNGKKQNKANAETKNSIVNSPERSVPQKVEETAAAGSDKPKKSGNATFDAQLRIALKNNRQQQNNVPVNAEPPKKNIPWFLIGAMSGELSDQKLKRNKEIREQKSRELREQEEKRREQLKEDMRRREQKSKEDREKTEKMLEKYRHYY